MNTKLYCPDCDTGIEQDDLLMCPSCSAVRPPFGWPRDELLGAVVDAGRYEVQRRLGSGGFGVVYEVLHTLVGQSRAMKVMDQKLVGQGDIQRRFIDEWDILDKLEHPHIVRCYEIGILPETRQPFMLLDLVRGVSLFEVIWPANVAKPRRFAPARAARMGAQVASALAHAHSRDLLHRDLKPDNILFLVDQDEQESVKVIDFGIAKILGTASVDRMTSRVVGTPEYMAPEQFNPGKQLDGRLDLWQLGAVMFFVITGWPPYSVQDDEPLSVYREMLSREGLGPRPSDQHPPMLDYPGLDRLVARLLATDPNLRPDNATEVVQELAALLAGELASEGVTLPSGIMPAATLPANRGGVAASPRGHRTAQTGGKPSAVFPDSAELKAVGADVVTKVPAIMRRGGGTQRAQNPPNEQGRASRAPNTARVSERATQAPTARATEQGEAPAPRPPRRGLIIALVTLVVLLVAAVVALLLADSLFAPNPALDPEFVWIQGGTFEMGSPEDEPGRFNNETRHKVILTRPFFVQTTEVTQAQWQKVMNHNPSINAACGPNCPVDSVNWWEVLEYLNRRSVTEGFDRCYVLEGCAGIPGRTYRCTSVEFTGLDCKGWRLPTEAEWEYAARAGSITPLHNGVLSHMRCAPVDPALDDVGWYCGNAGSQPHPVGLKRPNAWRLHDTAGNVNEWVWDLNFGDHDPEDAIDPLGPEEGAGRTYRGGTWSSAPSDCRVSSRGYAEPESRRADLGFRVVRTAQ